MPILVSGPPVTVNGYTTRYFSVGDILMSTGGGSVDEYGIRWLLESLTGWDNPPAGNGDTTAKVGQGGAYLGDSFFGPRIIELVGSIACDWETANAAIERLNTAIPISDTVVAIIGGAGPERQAEVRQNGEPLTTGSQSVTRFSLSLIAPDPRRYATVESNDSTGLPITSGGLSLPVSLPLSVGATVSSGRISMVNEGNETTNPLLAVSGPCPPFTITHLGSGRQLVSLDGVPAGRTLYLDTAAKIGLLDGTAIRVISGSWFDFPPGLNELQFNAPSYDPAALLAVSFRSAWR